jgi:hypothetical protein
MGKVGREGPALAKAEPEGVSALTGFDPARLADRIAELMWIEFCPGIRLTDEDVRHYRKIGQIALLRLREPTAAMIKAAQEAVSGFPRQSAIEAIWIAMIDAAPAIATDARSAETPQGGSVHEGAGGLPHRPEAPAHPPQPE